MDRNWLKKFMQVGVDVTYMHTNFGERDLSSFGDIATFKNGEISLSSMVIKKFNQLESAQKIYASRCCCNIHAHQFWWVWSLRFRRYCYFQKRQISLSDHPLSSKNSIDRNQLKKFMQVGVDIKCMHISFDGCGLSSFGDIATFEKWPNFPFGASACTPILVGVISPVSEIKLAYGP